VLNDGGGAVWHVTIPYTGRTVALIRTGWRTIAVGGESSSISYSSNTPIR